jgi:hypothetical protein
LADGFPARELKDLEVVPGAFEGQRETRLIGRREHPMSLCSVRINKFKGVTFWCVEWLSPRLFLVTSGAINGYFCSNLVRGVLLPVASLAPKTVAIHLVG